MEVVRAGTPLGSLINAVLTWGHRSDPRLNSVTALRSGSYWLLACNRGLIYIGDGVRKVAKLMSRGELKLDDDLTVWALGPTAEEIVAAAEMVRETPVGTAPLGEASSELRLQTDE